MLNEKYNIINDVLLCKGRNEKDTPEINTQIVIYRAVVVVTNSAIKKEMKMMMMM